MNILNEEVDFHLTRKMNSKERKKRNELARHFQENSNLPSDIKRKFARAIRNTPLYLFNMSEEERKNSDFEAAKIVNYPEDGKPRMYINADVAGQDQYTVDTTDPKGNTSKQYITGNEIMVMLVKHEILHVALEHIARCELIAQDWWKNHFPEDKKVDNYNFFANPEWQEILNLAADWDLSIWYSEKEKLIAKHLKYYGEMVECLVLELDHEDWLGKPLPEIVELTIEEKKKKSEEIKQLPPLSKLANFDEPGDDEGGGSNGGGRQPQGKPDFDIPDGPNGDVKDPGFNGEYSESIHGYWDDATGRFITNDGDVVNTGLFDADRDFPKNFNPGL